MTFKSAANVKTIAELIAGLPVRLVSDGGDVIVRAIVEDSRQASRGCLFIARSGHRADGRQFVAEAVQRGAVAVLTDDPQAIPSGFVGLVCADVAETSARIIERYFGNPSRSLKLIGITG